MTGAKARGLPHRSAKRAELVAAARDRRRGLDPETVAREQRIDEAIVDLEAAWTNRRSVLKQVEEADRSVAEALQRLAAESVTIANIARITALDLADLRRIRSIGARGALPD